MADLTGVLVTVGPTPSPTPTLTNIIVNNISSQLSNAPVLVNPVNTSAVVTPVPTPALNSFFDIAPLHGIQLFWLNTIPLWAFVGGVVFLYFMWYNVGWWRKCGALSPCYGYKDALMANSIMAQMNIVFTKSRKWFIRMLTYHSDGILYFKELDKTDMWHMGASSAVGKMGGMSAVITKDNFDEAIDPVADIALCAVSYDFNHGNYGDDKNKARAKGVMMGLTFLHEGKEYNLIEARAAKIIPATISSFDDYSKLRPILEAIWPDGIKIPGFTLYDPYASDKFTPKQRSPAEFGGNLIQDAYDYAEDNLPEQSWFEKNGVAMILLAGSCIVLLFGFLASR